MGLFEGRTGAEYLIIYSLGVDSRTAEYAWEHSAHSAHSTGHTLPNGQIRQMFTQTSQNPHFRNCSAVTEHRAC